jgi:hypothetical protein
LPGPLRIKLFAVPEMSAGPKKKFWASHSWPSFQALIPPYNFVAGGLKIPADLFKKRHQISIYKQFSD